MAKIAATYGTKRTSARMLDERRHRRSLLASFSSSKPDTNQSALRHPMASLQHDTIATIGITQTVSMHPLPTVGSSVFGPRQRITAGRLGQITSPGRNLLSTLNRRNPPVADAEIKEPCTFLPRSPPLVHPVKVVHPGTPISVAINRTASKRDDNRPDSLKNLSPVEIDDKITAMLAATALLKSHSPPKTPRASANRSRTIPRTTGYGSEKAIQALHKTKSQALVEDIIPESQKRSLSQAEESTLLPEQLTTIELRLNEGNNLNRRKVQKIVGGSIKRKPVYFQGQPARQSPVDDCRGSCSQVDGQPETPQASGFTYIRDPFEDEANFDEDLVDGVLCECPTGSSTPKSAALTPRLNRVDEEEDYSFQNPRIGPETVDAKSRNNSLDIFSPAMEAPVVETIPAEHRVKKHPSPSKKALEDLEAAFAMYTKLKPLEDGDKTDELAKENRDALSVADGNKLMRQSWSKCDGSEASRHTSQRVARRIRHSLPYRTTLASSQDIDDLRN